MKMMDFVGKIEENIKNEENVMKSSRIEKPC